LVKGKIERKKSGRRLSKAARGKGGTPFEKFEARMKREMILQLPLPYLEGVIGEALGKR